MADEVLRLLDTAPLVSLDLPLTPDLTIEQFESITIHQSTNVHDVFHFDVMGMNAQSLTPFIPSGTPFTLSIAKSSGPGITHYGYVHYVEPILDTGETRMRIVGVSAGYPLKSTGKKVFSDVTADQVASAIAKKHRLEGDVEPHPRKFRQIVQAGQSDWEFLRDIANDIGYSLRVEGATLQFVSRTSLSKAYRSLAPSLTYAARSGSFTRDIMEFVPALGSYLDHDKSYSATQIVNFVDSAAKQSGHSTISRVADPSRDPDEPKYQRFSAATANSFGEALQIAKDRMEAHRYPIQATVRCFGDPRISPGRSVHIEGTNAQYEGYWSVISATHHLRPGANYVIDARVGTEGLGAERHATQVMGTKPQVYTLRGTYPVPILDQRSARIGPRAVQIPDFFTNGPRWVSRRS